MARYHAETTPALKSWADVNATLREIALEEIALMDVQGDMEKQIIGIKKVAELQSKPHLDSIARLTRDVEEYVTAHKDELGKAKTKELMFGRCGFRLSTKIIIPAAQEKMKAFITALRGKGYNDCIKTKETVDKVALKRYGKEAVQALGAKWKDTDTFWCEPAREKLEQDRARRL